MSTLVSLLPALPRPLELSPSSLQRIENSWATTLPPLSEVITSFRGHRTALAHLLAVSPISIEKICRDPASLVWLSRPEIHAEDRGPLQMLAECEALRSEPGFDPHFRALRRMKQREMLRIALREVGGWATVEQTTQELTSLAEVCLRVVCDEWLAELSRRQTSA
ncbi:MAG: hypothetical protein EOP84_27170, partial [Verrucomicrobiaceae bacterium]